MHPSSVQLLASILFGVAIVHTLSVKQFLHLSRRFTHGSVVSNLFQLLGEVEVAFIFWTAVFLVGMAYLAGASTTAIALDGIDFTEPLFVFVIMAIAATRPIVSLARNGIEFTARILPLHKEAAFTISCLVVGPLLGSLITEPAAMTVTAMLLKDRFFASSKISTRLKYLGIGTLFVNVSIGGALTPYAAPPILMVAGTWGWDLAFVFSHLGWKALVAVLANALIFLAMGAKELAALRTPPAKKKDAETPFWLTLVHVGLLSAVVLFSHHSVLFLSAFIVFLGVVAITGKYQSELKIRDSLLVSSFLAGLVILGGFQEWWLKPLLEEINQVTLFLGAVALTSVTDNAALTYLGSQVHGLSDTFRYLLVAGSIAGGGLTVIANAPNPVGYSLLHQDFGKDGVSPLKLFLGALIPTAIAMISFWFLPHLSV